MDIQAAANAIKNGELVIFPTETVYGIGANALNETAVKKIFIAKKRPENNPLIVHLSKIQDYHKYAYINDIQENLLNKLSIFIPGALTIIFDKKEIIPEIVTANTKTVALRIPDNLIARELIELANLPICAPSANLYTKLSPTRVEHLTDEIKLSVSHILDDGPCQIGIESTVISLIGKPKLLRPGAITLEMLQDCIGDIELNNSEKISPGLDKIHYQPKTKVLFFKEDLITENTAIISFGNIKNNNYKFYYEISNFTQDLYHLLHEIDKLNLEQILVEKTDKSGVFLAIHDRLQKATSKF